MQRVRNIKTPRDRSPILISADIATQRGWTSAPHIILEATRLSGGKPGLGELVQTALDDYIRQHATELPNVTMLAPDHKHFNGKEPARD